MPEPTAVARILRGDAAPDSSISVRGWIHRHRTSGGIVFATIRDATGAIQVTVRKGTASDAAFEAARGAGIEASVTLEGTVRKDARAPGGYEISAKEFQVVGSSHDYPIQESAVTAESEEFLLDKRHLWLRSRRIANTLKVKAAMLRAFREWFDENGFIETTPSVITTNACEGGSTLFDFNYFGQKAFLSQSAQMYLEALSFSLEKVYCLTPSFRAEKSRTRKHLTEFGHLEEEAAWVDYRGNMDIQERLVSHVARRVAETAEGELVALGREPAELKAILPPFRRLTYDEAVDLLKKRGFPDFEWGEDFGVPHERALVEGETKPVFVSDWPAEIKAFYMALQPGGATARCADLLAPEGYGEIIGGSERSLDIESMKERLLAQAKRDNIPVDMAAYEWYFDLRRYGSVPHSGFGLGTERVCAWLSKSEHIRDTTPFPRTPSRASP
ncbi:MAG: asparagine--tRNA ligase [Thermoplasmatota archaeon]